MKKRQIKWELIAVIAMIVLDIMSLVHHIKLNGLYTDLILEIAIDIMLTGGIYCVIKDIRKN